ncbi:hypothetical protein RIF29_28568 [Crotalaria pallida]|uniref:Uncharacterized protein n=1 Tax=Crotalaria pallida TaxID=3830 RepID=A0AAN9ED17_CROPI
MYYLVRKTCSELLSAVEVAKFSFIYYSASARLNLLNLWLLCYWILCSPAFSGIYRVRGVCDDVNIIAMYELAGADMSPGKNELSAFADDLIVTPISLGADSVSVSIPPLNVKRSISSALVETSNAAAVVKKKANKGVNCEEVMNGSCLVSLILEYDCSGVFHVVVCIPMTL